MEEVCHYWHTPRIYTPPSPHPHGLLLHAFGRYTKSALDHLIFHQLQEFASPGYLSHATSRARREFGQDFYWAPGERTPDRPPNLGAMTGKQ